MGLWWAFRQRPEAVRRPGGGQDEGPAGLCRVCWAVPAPEDKEEELVALGLGSRRFV